jgi:hypothetical protein
LVKQPPPIAPPQLIVDFTKTNENQITVIMSQIIDESATGGSPITSYSLEWDQGSDGRIFTAVNGLLSNNIVLTYTFENLTKGNTYQFRLRVRNIYGWSPY